MLGALVLLLLLPLGLTVPREPVSLASASMGTMKQGKTRTDRKRSWVMIAENGGYTPLPGETTLYQSPQRTTLSLQTSHGLPPSQAYSQQCKSGVVYLTNRRVRNHTPQLTLYTDKQFLTRSNRSSTSLSPPPQPSSPSPSPSSTSPTRASQLPGSARINGKPSSTLSPVAGSHHNTQSWIASWSSRKAGHLISTTRLSG